MFRVRSLVAVLLLTAACGSSMLPIDRRRADASTPDGGTDSGTTTPETCVVDDDCDDGTTCNGAEICTAGLCAPSSVPTCDDGVSCTTDVCDTGLDRCVNTPDSSTCSANEICDSESGCIQKRCTSSADCDDGFPCNGSEICAAFGLCGFGANVNCDDGVACTVDTCVPTTGSCTNVADDGRCSDSSFCNGIEVCVSGLGCLPAVRGACDSSDACATVVCSEATQACSTTVRDQDGDGAIDDACGGTDCDDAVAATHPGATEVCTNSADDDCDGASDCNDSVCSADPACRVCAGTETSCTNSVDDDCDGLLDCADTASCASAPSCCVPRAEQCRNGVDDDCDGQRDCTDSQCTTNIACQIPCLPREICAPLGFDLDCDGKAGCDDSECAGSRFCR